MKTQLDTIVYKINFTILIIPFILDLFGFTEYRYITYFIVPWALIGASLVGYTYYKNHHINLNLDFFIQLILVVLSLFQIVRFFS